jgi:hypothetical protein
MSTARQGYETAQSAIRVARGEASGHNLFGVPSACMQVVCAQCHSVVLIENVGAAASGTDAQCSRCGAAIDLQAASAESGEAAWLIQTPDGHMGPFDASHMAALFDQGSVGWSSLIWRAGLKDWRAARRDPQLVTAVASVRGGVRGDTQRVAEQMSLLPEPAAAPEPALPLTVAEQALAVPVVPRPRPRVGLDSGNVWRQSSPSTATESTFADVLRSAPSILAPLPALESVDPEPVVPRASRPHSWLPSAQTMSVVAALAFVSGVLVAALWEHFVHRQHVRAATILMAAPQPAPALVATSGVGQPASSSAGRPEAAAAASAPTVARPEAAAAASAPTVARPEAAAEASAPTVARPEAAAAASAPTIARPEAAAEASAPTVPRSEAAAAASAPTVARSEAAAPASLEPDALRDRPEPLALAREFKRVSAEVRHCVGTSARGVDVEIYFDGPSGQVAGVNLHTSRLTPGGVECITQALRQMRVSPFRNAEHKLWHRFAF